MNNRKSIRKIIQSFILALILVPGLALVSSTTVNAQRGGGGGHGGGGAHH